MLQAMGTYISLDPCTTMLCISPSIVLNGLVVQYAYGYVYLIYVVLTPTKSCYGQLPYFQESVN